MKFIILWRKNIFLILWNQPRRLDHISLLLRSRDFIEPLMGFACSFDKIVIHVSILKQSFHWRCDIHDKISKFILKQPRFNLRAVGFCLSTLVKTNVMHWLDLIKLERYFPETSERTWKFSMVLVFYLTGRGIHFEILSLLQGQRSRSEVKFSG